MFSLRSYVYQLMLIIKRQKSITLITAKIAEYNCKFMSERLKIYNLADVREFPGALKDYLCQKIITSGNVVQLWYNFTSFFIS